jgi:nucleotide-binding universal stress UspA family protein
MFRRIMVATDGSPASEKAIEVAARLKLLIKESEVTVIHVSEPLPKVALKQGAENSHGIVVIPDSARADLVREKDEILEKARIMAEGIGIRVKLRSRTGDPASTIIDEAEKLGCDLIIIGGRGYGGFKNILGSVTTKVVNKFKGSVLVVK